jgi:hypothetical protein
VLSARAALLVAGVLLAGGVLAACGGGSEDASEPTASGAERGAATATGPGADAAAADAERRRRTAGSLPDEPQVALDLRDRPDGWPAGGGEAQAYVEGGYRVRGEATVRVSAERRARPGTQAVLLETTLDRGTEGATAGLFCRGDEDSPAGYEYAVAADGRFSVDRVDADGERRALVEGTFDPGETGEPERPLLLRLLCGAGAEGEPVTLGFTVGARPTQFTADERGLPAGDTAAVGVLARGGEATFRTFAAFFAE